MPDDATLNAMGAGELTILGMQCGLEGGQMSGEAATREALRGYRDQAVHPASARKDQLHEGVSSDGLQTDDVQQGT